MKRSQFLHKTCPALVMLALGLNLLSVPAFSAVAGDMACGRNCLAKGQYQAAVKDFEKVVQAEPGNCEGHFLLGQAYCKLKNYVKAREHLRTAIRVGRGSANAQKANLALMALPKQLIAPKTGAQTRMIASMLGLGRSRGIGGEARPTIIDFYATWCQPCKQLDQALSKVKSTYGERISFMRVDVDDPNNQTIMDQYDVSPIPTMVFLNPEGEVVTYSIGYSGETSIASGISKILAHDGIAAGTGTKTAGTATVSN